MYSYESSQPIGSVQEQSQVPNRTYDSLPVRRYKQQSDFANGGAHSTIPLDHSAPNASCDEREDAFAESFRARLTIDGAQGKPRKRRAPASTIDEREELVDVSERWWPDQLEKQNEENADEEEPTDGESPKPKWLHSRLHERNSERRTGLQKSWSNYGPEILIDNVFEGSAEWWQRVASIRTFRVPVVLLQMHIRRTILRDRHDRRYLLDVLPKGAHRRNIIKVLAGQGYTRDDLEKLCSVLEGSTDDERCQRFLNLEIPKPAFLLRYLIRPDAHITNPAYLSGLLEYTHQTYDGRLDVARPDDLPQRELNRLRRAKEGMDPTLFASTLAMFSEKCLRVESRLYIKVSELAIQFIENLSSSNKHPSQIFRDQCIVFNNTMASMGRRKRKLPPKAFRSLPHIWQAVKTLLSMSAAQSKPLLLNRKSFLTVREVLAGMDKTQTEVHNSTRHAETWPPYLQPGDGIDEMVVPDENWTRSVQAGVLQQEAGYASNERDQVLDILQGRAPDGSPTIQQRLASVPTSIGVWEAMIRATRNAEEAWGRFQTPPEKDMKPGLYEYAAMFKKLFQPQYWDSEEGGSIRPGDKDLSFPTKTDVNLSEFGKARLKPPTVSELYDQMLCDGIRPRSTCLQVLVANAKYISLAHKYLRDSGENYWALARGSNSRPVKPRDIVKIHITLFASYITCLCACRGDRKNNMTWAIRLCTLRFEHDKKNADWAPLLWGHILKAISHPNFLYGAVHQKLSLYMEVLDQVEARSFILLPMFTQFCQNLRRAVTVEIDTLLEDMENGRETPLTRLFAPGECLPSTSLVEEELTEEQGGEGMAKPQSSPDILQVGPSRLIGLLKTLVDREKEAREVVGSQGMDGLDQMLARRDPVKPKEAYEVVAALAFLGDFENMASFLFWLTEEWKQESVQASLQSLGHANPKADFTEVLCAFRLFAEPMLPEERVAELRDAIDGVGLGWAWPEDEAVTLFHDLQHTQAFQKLSHVVQWAQYWKDKAHADQSDEIGGVSVEPPKAWALVMADKDEARRLLSSQERESSRTAQLW